MSCRTCAALKPLSLKSINRESNAWQPFKGRKWLFLTGAADKQTQPLTCTSIYPLATVARNEWQHIIISAISEAIFIIEECTGLQSIQGSIFCPEVLQEHRGVKRGASHCFHEFVSIWMKGTASVYLLFKPVPQRLKVPSCNILLQWRNVLACFLHTHAAASAKWQAMHERTQNEPWLLCWLECRLLYIRHPYRNAQDKPAWQHRTCATAPGSICWSVSLSLLLW